MLRRTTILFILNLSVLCMAGFEADERPDYDSFHYKFFPSLNGWITVKDWEADWTTARVNCHLQDALLLSPWNAQFTEVINELGANFTLEGIHHGKEMYSTYENGSLKIIPSEVDGYENCTIFGDHNNKDCNRKLPYACFAAKEQVVPTCGNDTEYEFSKITGQCYKFHGTSILWREALQVCYDEGAQLAIINSDAEAQVLKDLFNKHPEEEIACDYCNVNSVSIGVYFWKQRNGWYTIDGNRLEDAGYNQWHSRNEVRDERRVGVIQRDGKIENVPRYWSYTFICEKDPVV